MASKSSILLLGAGELGTTFLKHLTSLPFAHITLGVRTPEKYQHLASANVSLSQVDLNAPSSELAELFAHFSILISATGFGASPSSVLKLSEEALTAGTLKATRGDEPLWFFPWQWGVDYDVTRDGEGLMPLFGAQKMVRDSLRKKASTCNLKWSIVSTGIFMSFLFEQFWGIVDRTREQDEEKIVVRCLRDWEHKITVTDVDDIGKVLARIIAKEIDAENKVVYVAGDTVSYEELANIIEQASGKMVEREEWDVTYLEQEVKKDPEDTIKRYRLVFAKDGVWWSKEQTVNHALNMATMDVETYACKLFQISK